MGIGFDQSDGAAVTENTSGRLAAAVYDELDNEAVLGGDPPQPAPMPGSDLVLPGVAVPPVAAAPERVEIPTVQAASRALETAMRTQPLIVQMRCVSQVAIASLQHYDNQTGNGAAANQQRRLMADLASFSFNHVLDQYTNCGLTFDGHICRMGRGIARLHENGVTTITPESVAARQRVGGATTTAINAALADIYTARTAFQAEVDRLAALATRTALQQRDLDQFRAILTAMPTVTRSDAGAYTLTNAGNRDNLVQALYRRAQNTDAPPRPPQPIRPRRDDSIPW